MGQSHFKSNIIGFAGTEYIASINQIKSMTTLGVTTANITTANITTASVDYLRATGQGDNSYIKMGAGKQYIFVGNANTEATVIAEATALVATPIKGSMYMSRKGNLWFYPNDTTASPVQSLA
jgi:hypothetical protein